MARSRQVLVLGVLLAVGANVVWLSGSGMSAPPQEQREKLGKSFKDGNYKDAYDGLRKLALDPTNDPMQVGADMDLAIQSLRRLGRVDEIDAFREAVIEVHKKNWRLLEAAARSCF